MNRFSPLTLKRIKRFKSVKRGYYSMIILLVLIVLSLFAEFIMNNKALVVYYNNHYYFPVFKFYPGTTFGRDYGTETKYRELKMQFSQTKEGWLIMPPIPYDPYEYDFLDNAQPPYPPSARHLLGTDDRGRDVLVRLFYGFRIAIFFSLLLTIIGYIIGTIIGAVMGYFGGWVDILIQRGIEIWSTVPKLYLCIIIAAIFQPSFTMLLLILTLFSWILMTYYIRTEIYREKAKDYCAAAKAMGCSHSRIIFKHLLPNCLVPLVSYFPFSVVAGINSLTALDFLGYGLPPPTPSWGELMQQGLDQLSRAYWITGATFIAIVVTLLLITFVGEAVREAFDPKQFAKYQ